MIIVNQNKNSIVNFDNILQVYRTECSIRCEDCNNSYGYLGVYKTEERAKEVLKEIIKSYRDYRVAECDGYTNVLQETAVFEMPKE